jgi:hypothetical protein
MFEAALATSTTQRYGVLRDLAERERPIICIDAVSPWLALLRVLENVLSEQGNGEHQQTEYQEQIPVEAGVRVSLGESLAEDKPTKYDDHVTHLRIVARVACLGEQSFFHLASHSYLRLSARQSAHQPHEGLICKVA